MTAGKLVDPASVRVVGREWGVRVNAIEVRRRVNAEIGLEVTWKQDKYQKVGRMNSSPDVWVMTEERILCTNTFVNPSSVDLFYLWWLRSDCCV